MKMRHGPAFWILLLLLCLATTDGRAGQSAVNAQRSPSIGGGVVVHVGCGDGRLTALLKVDDRCLVQGLDVDPASLERARRHFRSRGLGGRFSATVFDGRRLPYADNLVNLAVVSKTSTVDREELLRVLRPGGAVCSVSEEGEIQSQIIKPWPEDVDQWTHFLHGPDNNAVSKDVTVASPRRLQWVSDPVYGRHHDRLASISAMVSAKGRLFTIEDRGPAISMNLSADWRLLARDAFNGVILWELPITQWQSTKTGFRSGPVQLPRRLVAVDDRVYVSLNYGSPLSCLDAATGATIKTYEQTEGVDEILLQDGILYLAATADDEEGARRVLAVEPDSGKVLWTNTGESARKNLAATLTVGQRQLFFHDGQAVVALDRSNGHVNWRTLLPSVDRRPNWLSPTIVFHDGVVLCGDRATDYPERWKQHRELVSGMLAHGGLGHLTAMSAEDGEKLWETDAAECFHGAVDVFVIDDLVWASQGPARFFFERTRPILTDEMGEDFYIETVTGRDLRTGVVSKTVDAAKAFTLAHHHRCYRNKATERFIIMGRTGIEFINLEGGLSLRHNWTRGMCQYGVMPANGLLYTPPHPCACYNASKLNGFFAYSSRKEAAWDATAVQRLQKGAELTEAKHGEVLDHNAGDATPNASAESPAAVSRTDAGMNGDWPTYRSDNARSGNGSTSIADQPELAWSKRLSGRLSAPTSADGMVFVSDIDSHTVHALDLAAGNQLWSFVAGGRIDSPPTYWRGRLYFGSADGNIQCLAADDGTLIWRYLAAPQRASIVAWNQLESPWPVAGSVLVQDGSVYALAGRSSFLDGGMYFVKLNAVTGEPQLTRQIYSRDEETGRQTVDDVDDLYLGGLLYDIPSCDGDSIFVREARLSPEGKMLDEPRTHLYSVGGFLDDTWWHRYYMLYGTRFKNGPGGGLGRSGGAPYGRLLVFDADHVYGYGEVRPNRYHLFCASKRNAKPPGAAATGATQQKKRRATAVAPTIWSDEQSRLLARSIVLAGAKEADQGPVRRLIVAGPPAAALTSVEILRGEAGGLLVVVDAATGERLSQLEIESTPVFDGMCAARGHVIMSLASGTIAAFK